jgi:hypothetical protein
MLFPLILHAQNDNILSQKVDGVALEISIDDVPGEQSVWLNFEIRNTTDQVISFPYRYYWDFPVGMQGILTRKNGKSLTRFGSRHVLADDVLAENYDNYRVDLQPGGKLEGTVNLLDMVIIKDHYGATRLRPGKYKVGLSFFGNKSDLLDIIIPKG